MLFDDKAGFRRNIRNTVKCQTVRLEGDGYQKSVYCYSIVVSHLFLVHALDIVDFKHEWNLVLPQAIAFRLYCFILVELHEDSKMLHGENHTTFVVLKMREKSVVRMFVSNVMVEFACF